MREAMRLHQPAIVYLLPTRTIPRATCSAPRTQAVIDAAPGFVVMDGPISLSPAATAWSGFAGIRMCW